MIKEGTITSDSVTAIDAPGSVAGYSKRDARRQYSPDGFDEKRGAGYLPSSASPVPPHKNFFTAPDPRLIDRPFFVTIGEGGILQALQKLDEQLQQSGRRHIVSKKVSLTYISNVAPDVERILQRPTDWIGREVTPGQIGLVNHGGLPSILTRPGRYPGMPLRNWWARSWAGAKGRTLIHLILLLTQLLTYSHSLRHSR